MFVEEFVQVPVAIAQADDGEFHPCSSHLLPVDSVVEARYVNSFSHDSFFLNNSNNPAMDFTPASERFSVTDRASDDDK